MRSDRVEIGRVEIGGSSSSTPSSASSRERSAAKARIAAQRGRGNVEVDRTVEREAAVGEHEHAVGEHDRFVDVVGDEQDRRVVARAELGHEAVHPDARERVECAEGLVEQQQVGFAHECSGERRPLGLAARQRLGPVLLVAVEADFLERGPAAVVGVARRASPRATLGSTLAHGSRRGSW